MTAPLVLDYASHQYIAVTLQASSRFFQEPANLPPSQPPLLSLTYVGPVGSLPDVQLFSIPKSTFETVKDQVFATLGDMPDVTSVNLQVPKQRVKRGGDDL
ncbi:hypothetical protein FRB94_009414 [Tulasnella sp. JGI-2019a]|nr:hypothetical protein FRB93_006485 [Tulasnella sp. JGI-2019a]KAG9010934.1 hypothetical protein FRB94_009414 [Tulasnella sp. JGI-2019a]KAG9038431.1 hypothetical protein FRB95_001288 [Tulasnella sp. JGI-2019a]